MNRKLLNNVRKAMSRRGFFLRSRILKDDNSKPFRPNIKFPKKESRLYRTLSDKEHINRLKSLSK